jgi:ppGpp synthetase/RelA/SpoT-type nucleotidyltranferase
VAVEVQLRTVLQDVWAETYETVHRNTDLTSRDATLQASAAEFFEQLSRLFARREAGTMPGESAIQELLGLFAAYRSSLQALNWSVPPDRPTP